MAQTKNPTPETRQPRCLLELSTLVSRENYFNVDGKPFYFRDRDELTLLDFAVFNTAHERTDTIQREAAEQDRDISPEEIDEIDRLVDKTVRLIVININEVLPLLTPAQKAEIIRVFTELLSGGTTAGEAETQKSPSGESPL